MTSPLNSIWSRFSASLGATSFVKRGSFISMLMGRNPPVNRPDTYKQFLDELSKTIGQ
jgi:hypothetical protein